MECISSLEKFFLLCYHKSVIFLLQESKVDVNQREKQNIPKFILTETSKDFQLPAMLQLRRKA